MKTLVLVEHENGQVKDATLADNQIMRALQYAIAREPNLALANAGMPRLVANAA